MAGVRWKIQHIVVRIDSRKFEFPSGILPGLTLAGLWKIYIFQTEMNLDDPQERKNHPQAHSETLVFRNPSVPLGFP